MQDPNKCSSEQNHHASKQKARTSKKKFGRAIEFQQPQEGGSSETMYKMDITRVKNLHELSCDMLSLSFLEQEEEIYTLNDLREMY